MANPFLLLPCALERLPASSKAMRHHELCAQSHSPCSRPRLPFRCALECGPASPQTYAPSRAAHSSVVVLRRSPCCCRIEPIRTRERLPSATRQLELRLHCRRLPANFRCHRAVCLSACNHRSTQHPITRCAFYRSHLASSLSSHDAAHSRAYEHHLGAVHGRELRIQSLPFHGRAFPTTALCA